MGKYMDEMQSNSRRVFFPALPYAIIHFYKNTNIFVTGIGIYFYSFI